MTRRSGLPGTSTEAMPHTPTLSGESRVRSAAGDLHAGTLSCESLRHESDERLVALTRGGSERAFAEVTRRYQRQLRAYCSRIVGVERAQDAVQQALLQAFLALRDGAPREIVLRPWLYRIAHNCSVDLLRMGSWDYDQLDLEFDGVPQPPALFEQKEELRGLVASMRRLPEAQRQALTLRELEGCSYEEISARIGHTGSGVRQLIFRARTTLRKSAAAVLPFGFLRDRLMGMAPAVESHHVAGVAAVPAQSGGGAETLGAAALAVVAVLGGVAGGIRGGQSEQRRAVNHRSSEPQASTPLTAAPFGAQSAAQAASGARDRAVTDRARHRRRPAAVRQQVAAPAAGEPAAPTAQQLFPSVTAAPPTPPPAPSVEPAAPPANPAPGGEGTAVEQQVLPPSGTGDDPRDAGTRPAPPSDRPGPAPHPPTSPQAPPGAQSGPQSAPAKPKPPAKPKHPAKPALPGKPKPPAKPTLPARPQSPVAQSPGTGTAPGARPAPKKRTPPAPRAAPSR